jgi:hypothetical protein
MTATSLTERLRSARGQSMIEMAMVLPFVVVLVLGMIELSYALYDQHVVTKMSREGSNLISRNTTLQDAAAVLKNMSSQPVDFTGANSKVIFSVIKRGSTVGSTNYDKDILYQRYEYGGFAASSHLATKGTGSFGTGPEHEANNSDSDANLQITNFPPNMLSIGGLMYVTEIYTRHQLITPFDKFGITVPNTLYSIAYF